MDNVDNRPYWEYVAVLDNRTRPEHAQLHGLIYRYDDPFWASFYPPNGWRCRCRVNALSNYNLKKKDAKPGNSTGTLSQEMRLVSKKSGEYKPVTVYTDPLTGKKLHLMLGGVITRRIFGRAMSSVSEQARKVSVGRYSADTPNNPRQQVV